MGWAKTASQWLTPEPDSAGTSRWRRYTVQRPSLLQVGSRYRSMLTGRGALYYPDYLAAAPGSSAPHWAADGRNVNATVPTWVTKSTDLGDKSDVAALIGAPAAGTGSWTDSAKAFYSTGVVSFAKPGEPSPTDEGVLFAPTFPEPSYARWHASRASVFAVNPGGSSRDDPWYLPREWTLRLSFYHMRVPDNDAVLFQIGETLEVFWSLGRNRYMVRARLCSPSGDEATIGPGTGATHWYHLFKEVFPAQPAIGGSKTITIEFRPSNGTMIFNWNSDDEGTDNEVKFTTIKADTVLYPAAYAEDRVQNEAPAVHEPVTCLNSWDYTRPMMGNGDPAAAIESVDIGAGGQLGNTEQIVYYDFGYDATSFPDGEGNGSTGNGRHITYQHGGQRLQGDREDAGIYIAPHTPSHRYRAVILGDSGDGTQSILRAYSPDGVSWEWAPRERPILRVKDYYDILYPNGKTGATGTTKRMDNVTGLQLPDGSSVVYYDQRLTTTSQTNKIMSLDMGRDLEAWKNNFRVESAANPGGVGPLSDGADTLFTALEATGGDQFDADGVQVSHVQFDSGRSLFTLWYTGQLTGSIVSIGFAVSGNAYLWTGGQAGMNRVPVPEIEGDTGTYDESGVDSPSQVFSLVAGGADRYVLYTALDDGILPDRSIDVAFNSEPDTIRDVDPWEPVDEEWDTTTEDDDDPWTAGNRVLGLHRHYRGISGDLLMACGGQIYNAPFDADVSDRVSCAFDELWSGQTFGVKHFFEDSADECYISNGVDINLLKRDSDIVHYAPGPTMPAPDLAGSNLAGSLTPSTSFYFGYSYLRAEDSYESSISSIGEHRMNKTDQAVTVSVSEVANATPTLTGIDRVRIYGGIDPSHLFLATEFSLPTAEDVINASAWLNEGESPNDDLPAPVCRQMVKYHGIPFYFRLSGFTGRVAFGNGANTKRYASTSYFDFSLEGGGAVVAGARCQDYLLVFCERAIYAIYGDAPLFRWRLVSDKHGLVAPKALTHLSNGSLAFLARDAVYATNGAPNDPRMISLNVNRRIAAIPQSYIDECHLKAYKDVLRLWFPWRSNINKRCLVLDLNKGGWHEETGENAWVNDSTICDGAIDKGEWLTGDSRYGFALNLNYGKRDVGGRATTGIACRFETGQVALTDQPEWDVRARKIYPEMDGDFGVGDIGVFADGKLRSWEALFDIPSLSMAFVDRGFNPGGLIRQFENISVRSLRQASLSQYMVGRRHSIGFDAVSDKGDLVIHGFTILCRRIRRR